ncbi:hypothetical protein B0E48_13455 [Rhodanobacter sp. C03]|nr:hypothetical protein B0E48_13455 [Rhodanobacter sp. C03]
MTGIVDESGGRYSTTGYDAENRAILTFFGEGANNTQVTYNSDGTATTAYPLGHNATMSFSQTNGLNQIGSIDQSCTPDCNQRWKTRTYDTNGYPASYTDFKGNLTTTQYNSYGLLHIEIDGVGSANQRTTTTVWNGGLREPLTRQVQNAQGTLVTATAWAYNYLDEMNARCEIDPAVPGAMSYTCANTTVPPAGVRQWGYHYCGGVDTVQCPVIGLLLSVDGPRTDVSDVTSYAYYMLDGVNHHHGDLKSITDPLGHVTTYLVYDGAGRVTSMQDANGVVTNLTYTPRGWLATRSVGSAITSFHYWPYGAVKTITDPDNVTTTFTYDGAHRLTDITDAQGNDLHYTLDASGNKTGELIHPVSNSTPVKNLTRIYNTLGQLTTVIDGLNNTVFSASTSTSYDANGNLVNSVDALGYQRQQSFDALNRLSSTIANYNGADPATSNTKTTINRDALDRLASVIDPTALTTTNTFDGLSNRTRLQSPDTGTSNDTFDAAGNRLVHTDAKGIVGTSTYDADNRMASTSYADTTLNVTYKYDEANSVTGCSASSPIGRLTRIVEGNVTTIFCYDVRGNVIQKQQVASTHTDTTLYGYTLANRLNSESTPNHTTISYAYDINGHVSGVTVTPSGASSAPPTVVSGITWMPFGPISSYTLGNGQIITRTYDLNYRLTDLTSPALALHFALDAMGDIKALGNAPGANPATETYNYDPLYRLNKVIESNGSTLESYTYNPTGDRLSKTTTGLAGGAYLYTTGTHQLASIGNASQANDVDGNTTGSVIGANTSGYHYNARNRLDLAQLNGQTVGTYTYNALGERIGKVAATTERYAYNEAGQLIGEYGTTNRDYIWLGGLPVAVIDNTINGSVTSSTVNYVTADQLGTPRAVTNSAGTVIWSWAYQGNPFGEQQPTSTTGYVLNLRYPGQYYDAESGTNYNLNRTYESATGRYLQSDPIGLAGGISTYAYVGGNPLDGLDPLGLINLNLFPVFQDIYLYAQAIPDVPGQYIVGGHGSSTSMSAPDGTPLTPDQIAAMIESDDNYAPGEPVTLVSCDTGVPAADGSPSFAEQLADDLDASVTAPNSIAWLSPDGFYRAAGSYVPSNPDFGPSILEPGQFITYLPTLTLQE